LLTIIINGMKNIIMKNKTTIRYSPLLLFIAIIFLMVSSCSIGYMKDSETGLKLSYNGFTMDDVSMTIDGNKIHSNEIPYGRRVHIEIEGLKDFHIFNGKASIGCEVTITNKDGEVMLHSPDVFTATDGGYDAAFLEEIEISMPAVHPLKTGETYHWEGRFWDKYSEATMKSVVDVEIVENKDIYKNEFLSIKSQGLDFYSAFVEADYNLVHGNKAKLGQKLTLNILGATGFEMKDSMYQIDFFTSYKNLSNEYEFKFYDTLHSEEIRFLYSNYEMGSAVKVGEKYLWTTVFRDMNSDAKLEASIEIEITE